MLLNTLRSSGRSLVILAIMLAGCYTSSGPNGGYNPHFMSGETECAPSDQSPRCPMNWECRGKKPSGAEACCEPGDISGNCSTTPSMNPPGIGSTCDGQLVDLTSDEKNCGACGNICDNTQSCMQGECWRTVDECNTTKACAQGKACRQGKYATVCETTCAGYNGPDIQGRPVGTWGNDPCGQGGQGGGGTGRCQLRSCKKGQSIGPVGQEDLNDCASASATRGRDGRLYCD